MAGSLDVDATAGTSGGTISLGCVWCCCRGVEEERDGGVEARGGGREGPGRRSRLGSNQASLAPAQAQPKPSLPSSRVLFSLISPSHHYCICPFSCSLAQELRHPPIHLLNSSTFRY